MEASNEPTGRQSYRFNGADMNESDLVRNFKNVSMKKNGEKSEEAFQEEFHRIAMASRNRR